MKFADGFFDALEKFASIEVNSVGTGGFVATLLVLLACCAVLWPIISYLLDKFFDRA